MSRIIIFNVLLAAICTYSLWRGGAPERLGALSVLLAAASTMIFQSPMMTRFDGIEFGVLVVDLGLTLCFFAIAICANRYWPIWLAALQLVGTAAHGLKALNPAMTSLAYAIMIAMWSYPILVILAIGTRRHRTRLAKYRQDDPWTIRSPEMADRSGAKYDSHVSNNAERRY